MTILAPNQTVYIASWNTADVKQHEWRPRDEDRRVIGPPEPEWIADEFELTDRSLLHGPRGVRTRLRVIVESVGYSAIQAYTAKDALATVLGDVLANAGWYFTVGYTDGGAYSEYQAELEPGSLRLTKCHDKRVGTRVEMTWLRTSLQTALKAITGDAW